MADFGSPVAVNVDANPNKTIQTLSGILGLKQQQQAIAGQAADVQMRQQSAGQRAGIATFMQHFDPQQHVGADGTLDLDGVFADPKLRAAAGDQFPELMQQMLQVKQGQLQAKQQLVNLNDATRTQFQGVIGGLRTDPDVLADNAVGRQKVQAEIGRFGATGPDASRIAGIYGGVVDHAPPGKLAQTLSNMQLQAMDASTQAGRQAPSYLGTGGGFRQVNPQAPGGSVTTAPNYQAGTGPQYVLDPVTQTYHLAPGTGVGGPAAPSQPAAPATPRPPAQPAAPAAPPSSAPGAPGLPHYAPGEAATIAANTQAGGQRYNALVSSSLGSQDRINVLDNIIRLAGDPNAPRTGPGAAWKAAAATAIGQTPGWQSAKDDAAKFNELSKYLHQNALRTWQAAGGTGTDQQLSTIEGANPNVTQDPKTIVDLAKFNKAGELALQAKTTAHQAWMHQPGNNFANQADFENDWRQHFDPLLFQLKTWSPQEAQQRLASLKQPEIDRLSQDQAYLKGLGVY